MIDTLIGKHSVSVRMSDRVSSPRGERRCRARTWISPSALRRLRDARPLVQNITNDVVMNFTANALLGGGRFAGDGACARRGVRVCPHRVLARRQHRDADGTVPDGDARGCGGGAGSGECRGCSIPSQLARRRSDARRWRSCSKRSRRSSEGTPPRILAVATGVRAGRGVDADGSEPRGRRRCGVAREANGLGRRGRGRDRHRHGWHHHVGGGERSSASSRPLRAPDVRSRPSSVRLSGPASAPLEAAVSALVLAGVAGERAALDCPGPGSFAVRFLDALTAVTPERSRRGSAG